MKKRVKSRSRRRAQRGGNGHRGHLRIDGMAICVYDPKQPTYPLRELTWPQGPPCRPCVRALQLDHLLTTSRAELFALHQVVHREAAAIMHEKNRVYGTSADALHNYRQAAGAGVTTAQAIFSRLADKHGRLALVAKGAAKLERQDIRDAQNLLVQLEAACIERGDFR